MYLVKRLSQREDRPYMGSPNVLSFKRTQGSNINIGVPRAPRGEGPRGQQMEVGAGGAQPLVSPGSATPGREDLRLLAEDLRRQRNDARREAGLPMIISPTGESPWARTIARHDASNFNENVTQRNLFSSNETRRNTSVTNRNEIRARTIARIRSDGTIRQRFMTESNRVRKTKRLKAYREWLQFTRRNRQEPNINFGALRISKRKTPLWEVNRIANRVKRMRL